jgi:RNA polymerase sigma factor (sigma-70 family)
MDSSANEADTPGEVGSDELLGLLEQGRRQFLALIEHIRPELHRYCTRMTGSVADGEDVVQETLARASYELPQLRALPPLRPWLFRIAHNRAIDHWRREKYRASEPLDAALEIADEHRHQPDNVLARQQAVSAAITRFLELAPAQRGCVILKDVLDHSTDEIAEELGLSVPAVKAALHRGRAALQSQMATAAASVSRQRELSPAVASYARLFNAHDWDGVRSLLADDVRLDLVSRRKSAGRREVGTYFTNYERAEHLHLAPAWLNGHEVLAVLPEPAATLPRYFIELHWREGRVVTIRDYRYVPYIVQDAAFEFPEPTHHRSPP